MPLSLAWLKTHPGSYIGPALVSLTLESVQTGILINQSLTFWERAERELGVVRALVSCVTTIAFFQTCLSFYTSWRTFVDKFGDWYSSVMFSWADKIQSTMTVLMAAPVQAFLIWRCWTLFNRNIHVLVILVILLLASVLAGLVNTVQTFRVHFGIVPDAEVEAGPLPKVPISAIFVLSLTSSAVLDVLLTGIPQYSVVSASSPHVPGAIQAKRHFLKQVLRRLTVLIWEAALPPCICAVMTVVMYLTMVNENYWDLAFQSILGKLYVISLFVTLNGRAELQNGPAPGFSTNRISNLAWNLSTPIRLDINTDEESQGNTTQNTQGDLASALDNSNSEPSRTAVITPSSEKTK
ncbi:hypothetical protein C8Q74DRAFT_1362292 [Fomes fomentarius]|nr:hypothetical protein C8Q74DRAFT_1362292 [Fomes fomentarius]